MQVGPATRCRYVQSPWCSIVIVERGERSSCDHGSLASERVVRRGICQIKQSRLLRGMRATSDPIQLDYSPHRSKQRGECLTLGHGPLRAAADSHVSRVAHETWPGRAGMRAPQSGRNSAKTFEILIHLPRALQQLPAPSRSSRSALKADGGTPLFLVSSQLKVLASLQGELVLGLARRALETKDNLLGLWRVSGYTLASSG